MLQKLLIAATAIFLGSFGGGCSFNFRTGTGPSAPPPVAVERPVAMAGQGPLTLGPYERMTPGAANEEVVQAEEGGRHSRIPCRSGFESDPVLGCVGEPITDRARLVRFDKPGAGCKTGTVRTIKVAGALPNGRPGGAVLTQRCGPGNVVRVKN